MNHDVKYHVDADHYRTLPKMIRLCSLLSDGHDQATIPESRVCAQLLTMNRGPIVLTIDEAEYLLDQLPPPSSDDDEIARRVRKRLQGLLDSLRAGAEGVIKGTGGN
ncbi:hypothetical protein BKA70DRAFT_1562339 [Coprinopsis sp. MPI-PUGE-AT-0042]|nr:hypothetical protein BKA70DRAFT_1562339 [Coprinopsis sp. MPI-PUGE-AT-0042]